MSWLLPFLEDENAREVNDYMTINPDYTGETAYVPGVINWTFAVAVVYTLSTVGYSSADGF